MHFEQQALFSTRTTSQMAVSALRRYSERIVLQDQNGSWTGAAVLSCIATMQYHLVRRGGEPGRRVAVLSGNRPETWMVGVAAQSLGMCISWLHPFGSIDGHCHQIEDFEPDIIVLDSLRFPSVFSALLDRYGTEVQLLTLGDKHSGPSIIDREYAGSATVIDRSEPSDVAQVNYTGGTTGKAKGAWRTNASLAGSAIGVLSDFELPRRPTYLAIGPISHVTGTKILPTILRGGRVVMLDGFDPDLVCATIARERVDTALLVPTMIYGLLDAPAICQHDLSSLELLIYGASAMSVARLEQGLERLGPVFSQLYGQTECYPIAVLPREDHDLRYPERLLACGFASNSCTVALLDGDGSPVPDGGTGEICVRSPYIMGGYWKQSELTEKAFAGGWLHTGDVGRSDDEGRIYIVDRIKDLIITGGFNVYPKEVEDAITRLPGVAMAAVFGMPDAKWGEAVVAAIVPTAGIQLDAGHIQAAVRSACGPVQVPKQITLMDRLPLTALGKVDKKALKASMDAVSVEANR